MLCILSSFVCTENTQRVNVDLAVLMLQNQRYRECTYEAICQFAISLWKPPHLFHLLGTKMVVLLIFILIISSKRTPIFSSGFYDCPPTESQVLNDGLSGFHFRTFDPSVFLVAPSQRAVRIIWSLWCTYRWLLACLFVTTYTYEISKLSLDFKNSQTTNIFCYSE